MKSGAGRVRRSEHGICCSLFVILLGLELKDRQTRVHVSSLLRVQ